MGATEEDARERVGREAAEWLVANQAGTLSEADRVAFTEWLRASPPHVEEYLELAQVANALPAVVADPEFDVAALVAEARDAPGGEVIPLPEPTAAVARRSWFRPQALAASILVAAVGIAAASAAWVNRYDWFGLTTAYATAHAQRARYELPDGSTVELNAETALAVRYDLNERHVEVAHGEALFTVAHSTSRPFRVAAGGARVQALGTRFNVLARTDAETITVLEGSVLVTAVPPSAAVGGLAAPARALTVAAGQRIEVQGASLAEHAALADTASVGAWANGQIAFEGRPLGEVADAFNAYAPVRFEIDDPALRAEPISGRFSAEDYESFALFLKTLPGVELERTPGRISVRRAVEAAPAAGPATPPSG